MVYNKIEIEVRIRTYPKAKYQRATELPEILVMASLQSFPRAPIHEAYLMNTNVYGFNKIRGLVDFTADYLMGLRVVFDLLLVKVYTETGSIGVGYERDRLLGTISLRQGTLVAIEDVMRSIREVMEPS